MIFRRSAGVFLPHRSATRAIAAAFFSFVFFGGPHLARAAARISLERSSGGTPFQRFFAAFDLEAVFRCFNL
jgi:hypothetical protein